MFDDIKSSFRTSQESWRWAVSSIALAATMTAAAYFGAWYKSLPVRYFLDDPNYLSSQPFYYGAFELASVLIMWCTACILIFSSFLLRRSERRFALASGALSATLALDDLFMFHEHLTNWNLPEGIVYAGYLSALVSIAVAYRRILFTTPVLILGASMTFYLMSGVIDQIGFLQARMHASESIVELFGVSLWAGYFLRVARQLTGQALNTARSFPTFSPRDRADLSPPSEPSLSLHGVFAAD
jgi:hypothetical protein